MMPSLWRGLCSAIYLSLFAVCFFLPFLSAPSLAQERVLVFAAASLKDALEPLGTVFERSTGISVTFSFAATSALARQVDAGAPADLFISADEPWINWLEGRDRLFDGSISVIAGNRLALATAATNTVAFSGKAADTLFHFLENSQGRIAIADPDHVPAGRYAKASLQALGLYELLKPRFVVANNVRLAAILVGRAETALGIVYLSDILADPSLRKIGLFEEASHPPIRYLAGLTKEASKPARVFLDFLRSTKAAEFYKKAGLLAQF